MAARRRRSEYYLACGDVLKYEVKVYFLFFSYPWISFSQDSSLLYIWFFPHFASIDIPFPFLGARLLSAFLYVVWK